jgi:hypothetical protein
VTTIKEVEKKCALCGKESKQIVLVSTNTFGSPDLDTRPPEMERSTIGCWIHSCLWCGYCATDISEGIEKASEIVRSYAYQQQLHNPRFPDLANEFLCFSLILESVGYYADAGWPSVHAAWACDDEGNDLIKTLKILETKCEKKEEIKVEKIMKALKITGLKIEERKVEEIIEVLKPLEKRGRKEEEKKKCLSAFGELALSLVGAAKECRIRAATLLLKARENGQSFAEQAGAEEALIVDLLRRAGQFEAALRICDEGFKKKPVEVISNVLQFQKKLIAESDVSCYTIKEAIAVMQSES